MNLEEMETFINESIYALHAENFDTADIVIKCSYRVYRLFQQFIIQKYQDQRLPLKSDEFSSHYRGIDILPVGHVFNEVLVFIPRKIGQLDDNIILHKLTL